MRLHVLGICGTFMGGLAAIARAEGHEVSGCDANVYPPMSTQLESLGIALFEYLLQVPANRIGFAGGISLAQLKILQEVITLAVFVPFAMLYMGEAPKWNYLWAALCLMGAVYFIFFA